MTNKDNRPAAKKKKKKSREIDRWTDGNDSRACLGSPSGLSGTR